MSQEEQQSELAKRTVVYRIPGMEEVTVRQDLEYRAAEGALPFDLYAPPEAKAGEPGPAVLIVAGYPGAGSERIFGRPFKDMGFIVSWARLLAASGLTAITYTNRQPVEDLHALLAHLRENAAALGIDGSRIGLFASSGNVPLALSLLVEEGREAFACAVFCYGFLLDSDGSTAVAEAAKQYGFAYPLAGRSVADLAREVPLFLARAGRDEFPHINETMDRFVGQALARNLPLTLVNHPEGPHAFDLFDDSAETRQIVRWILAFLRFHLQAD